MNHFFCYFCGIVSFVPAQLPAPANSHAPQGGCKAEGSTGRWGGAPRPRPAVVWVWVAPSRCANSKQKSKLVQYVHTVGEQPGPAPAFWCLFNPPGSLRLVSHVLTMQTRPRAACEWSWRAKLGWDLAACLSLPGSDLLWGQSRASPQQPGQCMLMYLLLPCLGMQKWKISPKISFPPPSPGLGALQTEMAIEGLALACSGGETENEPRSELQSDTTEPQTRQEQHRGARQGQQTAPRCLQGTALKHEPQQTCTGFTGTRKLCHKAEGKILACFSHPHGLLPWATVPASRGSRQGAGREGSGCGFPR